MLQSVEDKNPPQPSLAERVRTRCRELIERKAYSQRDLAYGINYSVGTVSSWLSKSYGARDEKITRAAFAWLRRIGEGVGEGDYPSIFIETAAARAVMNEIERACQKQEFVACIGRPGVGKTEGVRAWVRDAKQNGRKFAVVTAIVLTTPLTLVKKIAAELGCETRGSAAVVFERIVQALTREPSVLIFDEAQHLNLKSLETVRAIHDATNIGVCFLGSDQLQITLTRRHHRSHMELAQLQSRLHHVQYLGPMSSPETAQFVTTWWAGEKRVGPDVITRVHSYANGEPRRVVRLLEHLRDMVYQADDPVEVTPQLVDFANEKLLRVA